VGRDHGGLALIERAVVVEDDPIAEATEFVGASRVGIERRVVAVGTMRVQDREPCLARWVEAPRRDLGQFARGSFLAVLAVYIQ
jgi:hypothetical protein